LKKSVSGKFLPNIRWVFYVSRRFSRVDRKGRSAVTSFLASLGICFGVMTLITVLSVMNGFQMSFIDAIMEVSSYHVRVANVPDEQKKAFDQFCTHEKGIVAAIPFYEAQSLMVGSAGWQKAALVRAVPADILKRDRGFSHEMKLWSGSFDLSRPGSIVLGVELARQLGVHVGSTVNLLALSGGNDVELIAADRMFVVTGLFRTGYADINSSYSFISLDDGKKYFGSGAAEVYGIKMHNTAEDGILISRIAAQFPGIEATSWKSYNRAFFGALRIEKNMLLMLVLLIFIVVGINIFNGMRRMVYERKEEISVLSALGARTPVIQTIFTMQGFLIGCTGAIPGVLSGILLSIHMETVFMVMSKLVYFVQVFGSMLIAPESASYIQENPMYQLYANIPARIVPHEVLLITLFGIFSALAASWIASRSVLKMTIAEVLRDD
jgi:lipoprotein-releasing system permease protein